MEFENRWYQPEAANNAVEDILSEKNYNPVTVMPTGSGKSVVQCLTVDEFLTEKPKNKVLCLSHVDKILNQNYSKLCEYFDEDFVGLYSAGLGQRNLNKITVAGIQSVYRRPELFDKQNIGLIVVDECHLVNSNDEGMYRGLIKALQKQQGGHIPVWGMTASPYRTGQGYIYKKYQGYDPLFNKLSYDLSSYENYNTLIDQGYLVNLIPAPTAYKMDVDGIPISAGDFVVDALADKFNREEITKQIIQNVIKYGKKYKKWLGFAIDKLHALAIKYELEQNGIVAECIYSGMKKDQYEILADYKAGKIKCLINVNMLTTGLDIPEIDLIFFARPTQSPVFHVQANGRGARPAPWIGKTHCLVLDFAGNTDRLGPVNDLNIFEPGSNKKLKGEKSVKYCKNCGTANSTRAVFCIACEEEFKFETKLSANASKSDIVKRDNKSNQDIKPQWIKVKSVQYSIHQKAGSPSSLRVMYNCGMNTFSEWICIDHDAEWLKRKAMKWIDQRWTGAKFHTPNNLTGLYVGQYDLKKPTEILLDVGGKFPEILDYKFEAESANVNFVKTKDGLKIDIDENKRDELIRKAFGNKLLKELPKENFAFDDEDDIPF